MRQTLTVHEGAALLGRSPRRVYQAIAARQVPEACVLRLGRRVLLRRGPFLAWLGVTEEEEREDGPR